MPNVEQVKKAHEKEILSKPGVVGIAVSKEGCSSIIVVMVENEGTSLGIPSNIEGIPVKIKRVGKIQPQ